MKRFKILAITILAIVLFMVCVLLIPRKYNVPATKSLTGVRYWDLSSGSRIAYVLKPGRGTKKSTPIIFLQGGPGGFISDKTTYLDFLTDYGYDLYLYDQAGSGHSARLAHISDYSATRHKKDLEEIIAKTGAEKVILIGQSWGAMLATLFIADNVDRVKAVVFTGPGPVIPINRSLAQIPSPDSLELKSPESSNQMANEKVNNLRSRFVGHWAAWFNSKLASDNEMDAFQTTLDEELNKSTVSKVENASHAERGGGYYVQQKTIESFPNTPDPRPKFDNCPVPALILKGQYDNQKWGYLTEYFQMFPKHEFHVIKEAGHSIPREQPEIYKKLILHFLLRSAP